MVPNIPLSVSDWFIYCRNLSVCANECLLKKFKIEIVFFYISIYILNIHIWTFEIVYRIRSWQVVQLGKLSSICLYPSDNLELIVSRQNIIVSLSVVILHSSVIWKACKKFKFGNISWHGGQNLVIIYAYNNTVKNYNWYNCYHFAVFNYHVNIIKM